MKRKTYNIKKTLILSLLVLYFMSYTPSVKAQSILPLTVAPARQELSLNPGEDAAFDVRFYNLGDSPVSGILKVADFIVDNKEGTPRIIDDVSQASPRFAASNWVSLPYDQITIAANDKVSLQAKIKIPINARPGGRYIAVYFEPVGVVPQAVGSQKEAGVGVTSRIASLIYIRVAGPITEQALITRLFAPIFYEYGPINVETEILNRGDYHIRPKGVISLTNMFGGLIAQDKLKEQNIFPDASRSYLNTVGQKWMFGRYKIDLAASYGEKGLALSRFIYVWVFPWRLITIIFLTLIILILLGKNIYKKIITKEIQLEQELSQEKEELRRLKEELKKRKE